MMEKKMEKGKVKKVKIVVTGPIGVGKSELIEKLEEMVKFEKIEEEWISN